MMRKEPLLTFAEEIGNHPGNAKQATRDKMDLYSEGYRAGRRVTRLQVAGLAVSFLTIASAVLVGWWL
jgi:hypothetical protein